jgi:hypothetical protein
VVLEASQPGELFGLIPRVAPDQAANLVQADDLEPVEALGHSACVAAAIGSLAPVDVEDPDMQVHRWIATPRWFEIPPVRTSGHPPAAGQQGERNQKRYNPKGDRSAKSHVARPRKKGYDPAPSRWCPMGGAVARGTAENSWESAS